MSKSHTYAGNMLIARLHFVTHFTQCHTRRAAAATGSEAEIGATFADTYRMLHNRIDIFVNLPMDALDKVALQERLDEIGTTRDSIEPASA